MPKKVVDLVNKEWKIAGNDFPSDLRLSEMAPKFRLEDVSRFERFFKDKKDRQEKNMRQNEEVFCALDYGQELLDRIEIRIFRRDADGTQRSLESEGLYYVTHLERMDTIRDVGIKVVRVLATDAGGNVVMSFLKAFWDRLKLHFLVPEFKGKSAAAVRARFDAAAALEISMRHHFPPAFAVSLLGQVCHLFASENGASELHARLRASVSKRIMVAVSYRLRATLLCEA